MQECYQYQHARPEDMLKENGLWVTEDGWWKDDNTDGYFHLKMTLKLHEGESCKLCDLTNPVSSS